MRRRPRYCRKCGNELIYENEISSYDPINGKPSESEFLRCPTIPSRVSISSESMEHDLWEFVPWMWGTWYRDLNEILV